METLLDDVGLLLRVPTYVSELIFAPATASYSFSVADLIDMPVTRHYDSDIVRVCRHATPAFQFLREAS